MPADDQARLDELYDAGALTAAEYERRSAEAARRPAAGGDALARETTFRNWAMILHLSQLLAWFAVPFAGIIAPVAIWQWKKNDFPEIDAHGKMVVNWTISSLLYGVIFGLLCLILVGIPLLIGLVIAAAAFPVIGGIKASNGELWNYPGTIHFFK